MSNIQRLLTEGNKSHRLFGATVTNLKSSQGFYTRLFNVVNDLDENGYAELYDALENQNFNYPVDIILWLEC